MLHQLEQTFPTQSDECGDSLHHLLHELQNLEEKIFFKPSWEKYLSRKQENIVDPDVKLSSLDACNKVSVSGKPPQCLKNNFKENLAMLSPPWCIRLWKVWGERGNASAAGSNLWCRPVLWYCIYMTMVWWVERWSGMNLWCLMFVVGDLWPEYLGQCTPEQCVRCCDNYYYACPGTHVCVVTSGEIFSSSSSALLLSFINLNIS